jgi:putative resolvase
MSYNTYMSSSRTYLPVGKAADFLGVCVKTLQRWDREGSFVPIIRTDTNRRMYTLEQLEIKLRIPQNKPQVPVAYCRVSSQNQKPDLANQVKIVQEFAASIGLAEIEMVTEVGGGLNFRRKKFQELISRVELGEISCIILAHKDRLVRFGFEFFEDFCKQHKCEIKVLNQTSHSPEEEMVQDLMTIVHCFSSRLYGLRNYRKALQNAISQPSTQDQTPANS